MRRARGAPHTGPHGWDECESVSLSNSRTIGREVVWVRSLKLKNRMFGLAQAAVAENEPHRRRTCSSSRSCAKVAYMQALRGLSEVQPPPQRTGSEVTRRRAADLGIRGHWEIERTSAQGLPRPRLPKPRRNPVGLPQFVRPTRASYLGTRPFRVERTSSASGRSGLKPPAGTAAMGKSIQTRTRVSVAKPNVSVVVHG